MEEGAVIKLISQYLHERGYEESLKKLEAESGRLFSPETAGYLKTGKLKAILDDFALKERQRDREQLSVERLFGPGHKEYVNQLWCSFDGLCDGVNILVVRLTENGAMVFGGAKSQLGVMELPLPLCDASPPTTPIPTMHTIGSAGVLCVDIHPKKRNLLLCGNMDSCAYLVDISTEQSNILQTFTDHTKYVVRALWAPSGRFFVTGSYDHSLCVYRASAGEESYELEEKIAVNGAVEGVAFAKDTDEFVVGVRGDYLLHCYSLSSEKLTETRTINMNKFGDDFVSFVPMHVSFSPDGNFFLLSTDRDRLILYSWETGKQIANFYGASNDELSQPRHCWDSSGNYIYGTSQDHSICVWEIRSQKLVARLTGHSGTVRNIHFCGELGVLVSCAFDGTLKLWKRIIAQP